MKRSMSIEEKQALVEVVYLSEAQMLSKLCFELFLD